MMIKEEEEKNVSPLDYYPEYNFLRFLNGGVGRRCTHTLAELRVDLAVTVAAPPQGRVCVQVH